MRTGKVFLTLFVMTAASLTACGRADQGVPDTLGTQEPAEEQTTALRVISGELGSVDLDARTFTLVTADGEYVFAFADATDVVGASGAQGLAAQEGVDVTVHYRDDQDVRLALKIEILEWTDHPGGPDDPDAPAPGGREEAGRW